MLVGLFSWRAAFAFGITFMAAVANAFLMMAIVVALGIWAATGLRPAIYAMSVVAILRYANPGFASFPGGVGILFWLVMIIGSIRILLSGRRVSSSFRFLLAFFVVAVVSSVFVSKAADVSVMKAVSFFLVSAAMLMAAESMSEKDFMLLQRWVFSVAIVVAALSLATLPWPGIAYRLNGRGFQGILSHPQEMGVALVPFAAWAVARAFNHRNVRIRWFDVVAILVWVAIIVMTRARTAMLALIVAVALATLVHLTKSQHASRRKKFAQIAGIATLVLTLLVVSLATREGAELIEEIVFKGSGTATVGDAFDQSRGSGVKQQLEAFVESPLLGHGFGVYTFGVWGGEASVVRLWGIPLSAPAEKGFAFTAVLEEVGILGALLFYALIIAMGRQAAASPNPEVLGMYLGAIMVNFGEAVIFSPGGIGLHMWLLIAVTLAGARFDAANSTRRPLAKRA